MFFIFSNYIFKIDTVFYLHSRTLTPLISLIMCLYILFIFCFFFITFLTFYRHILSTPVFFFDHFVVFPHFSPFFDVFDELILSVQQHITPGGNSYSFGGLAGGTQSAETEVAIAGKKNERSKEKKKKEDKEGKRGTRKKLV